MSARPAAVGGKILCLVVCTQPRSRERFLGAEDIAAGTRQTVRNGRSRQMIEFLVADDEMHFVCAPGGITNAGGGNVSGFFVKRIIGAGVVIALGVLGWFLVSKPITYRLPNGSFIAVNSVTLGTNHSARFGEGGWRDLAHKHLPARYASRFAPNSALDGHFPGGLITHWEMRRGIPPATNCTVIWFRCWGISHTNFWPFLGDQLTEYECVLLDAHGQARAASSMGRSWELMTVAGGEGRTLAYAVFPPVSGRHTIRLQSKQRDYLNAATHPPMQFVMNIP